MALQDLELAKFVNKNSGFPAVRVTDTSILGGVEWDYVEQTQDTTTDTWTFKSGGSAGTTTAVMVITYTDSGKGTISNVERTA